MNILIVEDIPCLAEITNSGLERLGFDFFRSTSLAHAFERLKQPGIDAIVLDLSRPHTIGMDMFRELRSKATDLPIVVLSEQQDHELAMQYVKGGAQDYLIKGITGDDSTIRCLQYAIERNSVELELRKGVERLRVILENSYDAFVSMDSKWHITDWNSEAEKTFGWTREEALGQTLICIMPAHLKRQYMHSIKEYFLHQKGSLLKTSRDLTAVHRDGHEFPIEIGIFRIEEDSDYKFCAFVRNITDRKKSSEELEHLVQERTEKLTQSNEELRQFAKVASHDLQEPLRAVEGFANLLNECTKGKVEKNCEEFIEYILDGVQRMQHLIRSVLVHSQISNDDSIKYKTNCNRVLDDILHDMRDTIAESKTTIEVDRLPNVDVERSQVVQLLQNLIGNSIKYRGPEAPQIFISAERNLNKWLFSLRDNGIGIEAQYSEKIFDMFSRLHAKTKYPGTGMGLAICKRIVTSHGGTIWVESKVGEGSIFLFTLPAVGDTRSTTMKDNISILLAEDTPSDVRLTEEALKRSNLKYNLAVVNDGVEATDYLHKLRDARSPLPDIILLDLNMPRKNGHEVLNEIKNDPALRHIPVVLLTVSERDEDVLEALRQRMNYYVAKPVTSEKISTLLRLIHDLQTKSPDELAVYSDEETHVRLVLAGNPHTSIVALTKLAHDPNERVRCRVAENPGILPNIIEKLAQDPSADVRLGVCENPNTPAFILAMLVKDASDDVRLGLSSNPRIPPELLKELALDENIFVSAAANNTLAALCASP